MTSATKPSSEVLPALGLLPHTVRVAAPDIALLLDTDPGDLILVDARADLVKARAFIRLLATTGVSAPIIAIVQEGGLIAVSADWGMNDFVLNTAGPAEIEARLRFAITNRLAVEDDEIQVVTRGDLTIEEESYSARIKGRSLDLTYKEFELLKYLAQHPGRVFSRGQLLQEVWGYDYFGGTRTVDVHVRRLRAKLGNEHESLIGTVRNVGYKFVTPHEPRGDARAEPTADPPASPAVAARPAEPASPAESTSPARAALADSNVADSNLADSNVADSNQADEPTTPAEANLEH
nr:response regulator transcription factor [Antricoccus suffuscus]